MLYESKQSIENVHNLILHDWPLENSSNKSLDMKIDLVPLND